MATPLFAHALAPVRDTKPAGMLAIVIVVVSYYSLLLIILMSYYHDAYHYTYYVFAHALAQSTTRPNGRSTTIMWCYDFGRFPNQAIVAWHAMHSFKYDRPMRKMIDDSHITRSILQLSDITYSYYRKQIAIVTNTFYTFIIYIYIYIVTSHDSFNFPNEAWGPACLPGPRSPGIARTSFKHVYIYIYIYAYIFIYIYI